MLTPIRSRLTYANVMATVAVFIALGGGAYAVTQLDRNSVKSRHIVNGQVKGADLVPTEFHSAGLPSVALESCSGNNRWESLGPVGYNRDPTGEVQLSGSFIACGNAPDLLFTLPKGFRPAYHHRSLMMKHETNGPEVGAILIVNANTGQVSTEYKEPNWQFSIDGISFQCGPSGEDGCP